MAELLFNMFKHALNSERWHIGWQQNHSPLQAMRLHMFEFRYVPPISFTTFTRASSFTVGLLSSPYLHARCLYCQSSSSGESMTSTWGLIYNTEKSNTCTWPIQIPFWPQHGKSTLRRHAWQTNFSNKNRWIMVSSEGSSILPHHTQQTTGQLVLRYRIWKISSSAKS